LPPSFFQQDIGRLTLSRHWYALALPSFYPRIEYTPRVISRLIHRKSLALERSLSESLRSVNIVLDGGLLPPGLGAAAAGGSDSDPDTAVVCFNPPANLTRFSNLLANIHGLQAVRFAARWQNRDWPADPLHPACLPLRSLEPYLDLTRVL